MTKGARSVRDPRPTHLYRLFDGAGLLLYVGVSSDLAARISSHRTSRSWGVAISRAESEAFETRAEALIAERRAIKAEHPLHNRVYSRAPRPKPVGRRASPSSSTTAESQAELVACVELIPETTRRRDSAIVALREQGMSLADIAELAGMTAPGIHFVLKRISGQERTDRRNVLDNTEVA